MGLQVEKEAQMAAGVARAENAGADFDNRKANKKAKAAKAVKAAAAAAAAAAAPRAPVVS